MILDTQTTDPSPRPTFDFTAKLFSNIKLNWDGPHMPQLAPMLVVPAGRNGADAAAANKVSPPPPSPHLVTRVKRLEGLLQQRKRRLVLSDSEGEEATTKEQDINLDSLHKLASTSLGGDTTVEAAYTIYKASQDAHASLDAGHNEDETIPAGSTPIPSSGGVSTDSSMDPADQAAAAPSSTIPAADKGKAPMVDYSLPADLLSEQEHILKNLYDYQLGEDLVKKLHAEQEAEF
nr:hypothetical protein [Tanacetum cinerariifolium]